MLTNEEALRLIKECDECFVVWATDQNAIVAVHPIPTEEDRLKALASMGTGYEGPTKGRFLKSRDVTLQTLQAEQAEITRVATRVAIFNSWTSCGIDALIDILNVDWSTWDAFTDAAGNLPTLDQDIIAQLIKIVETPFMFGPRWEAMVALGKIGTSAGPRAVDVIEKSIYDSSDHVTAVRNRVVARIRQPASNWIQCPHCYRGYVDGIGSNIPSVHTCTECLGLGRLPRSGTA